MKVDVIGSNSLLFANLPPASQVPGRTYRVSDVGPAPGILLTSNGTRYRPSGGRQVLYMSSGAVTVQDNTLAPAFSVGPFPGGLVRSGMVLEARCRFDAPAVSSTARVQAFYISNSSSHMSNEFRFMQANPSVSHPTNVATMMVGFLRVSSNTSAAHTGGIHGGGAALDSGYYFNNTAEQLNPVVDFSLPWYSSVGVRSVTETAVNISSATWAGGIATFNTSAAHTLAVGDKTVTAGVTPSGWNIPAGAIVLSVPTTTQFTVAMAADPGAYTSGGTSSRISNVISQSYVLELVG